jgi:hypothetical protein
VVPLSFLKELKMWYVDLAKFKLGVKFEWQKIDSIHTFKSGNKEVRTTRSCFAKLYTVDADREIPLKTGHQCSRTWLESRRKDDMRKKDLAEALKAAGIKKDDRILVWYAYAEHFTTKVPKAPKVERQEAA